MLRLLAAFVVILVAFTTTASSQTTWPHTWGGNASDSAAAIARDTAGNIYVAGATQSFGAGGSDVLLLKYNAAGTLLWTKTWGGNATDYATAVAVDSAGGVYVTGGTDSFSAGWRDVFLLKFDGSGNLLWSRTWGGYSYDVGHDIAFDSTGNVLVAAETYSYKPPSPESSASAVLKFTPSGDLLWSRIWASGLLAVTGPAYDGAYSLDIDGNGNIIFVGITWDYNVTPYHNSIAIVKLDSSGNLIWNRNWAGPSEDEAWGTKVVRADGNGNIYVAGRMTSQCLSSDFSTCDFDVLLLKLDANGQLVWSRTWKPSTGWDAAISIAFDGSGNLVVTGVRDQYGPTETALLLRFDPSGNLLSSLAWSGGPGAVGSAVLVDPTSNIFVAGNAPNNIGSWQNATGATGTENGTLTTQSSAVGWFTVTLGSPSGTLTSPSGVVDVGGGGQDVFIGSVYCAQQSGTCATGGAQVIPGPPPPPPNNGPAQSPTSRQASASEPISTGNGNYYYQHTDFSMAGRGLPLVFQRSYNVLDSYAGPLGANWTHSLNIILTQTAAGAANIRWGDGHGETFTLTGTTYVPQPGVFSTFVANADGTFTLAQKNQTKYNFASTGKLTNVQDRNGNTALLGYDSNGNLTQITDPVGRALTLTYDASNRITQVTDPLGRTVTYAYDGSNNLASVTDPAGGVTQYAYDSNHRVTKITLPNGATLLQNSYDSQGRVVSQTNGRGLTWTFAYDAPSQGQTTITDARGNKTVHSYDSALRIVGITDALAGTTSYAYDANNDRTSVTNQNGKTTSFAYDAQGNVTGITDPLGNAVTFTYDLTSNLLSATNAKGKTTTFSYDSRANLTQIQDAIGSTTKFVYDSLGELTTKTDARRNSTAFTYDSSGNLTRISDALSHSTTLAYDGIGRLTSITDPNGHAASSTYDALSRLTKITDPLGNATQFAYDPVGNLLKITDANGNAVAYAYDTNNNLTAVTDALGHITRYAYDANNNRVNFTNAKGNTTAYVYDALNRLIGVTDPLSFVTAYTYDAVGNVSSVTDAKGQTNRFTYDALNRLIAIAYADGKNVAYSYDANGNRTGMIDSHGTTTYSYDAVDRFVSVVHPGGKAVGYTYDQVGNRSQLAYPDGKVVKYSFDAANRLSSVTDWLARITGYAYDAANNLTRTAYPNNTSIAFTYDSANRLTKVVNSALGLPLLNLGYTLDAVGNRKALSVDGVVTQFGYDQLYELGSAQLGPLKSKWTYDAAGNRLKEVSPFGTTLYTYDAADRLLQAGTRTFTYDANGNQTSATKALSGSPVAYSYDAANRLVAARWGKTINSNFGYDGDGNRVAQTTGKGTYSYINDVAAALPVVLQESGPDGNISYAYGLGLIEAYSSSFNYFYHYDGLGSVIALTNAAGKPAAGYAYDAWGNALLTITDNVGTKNKFRFTGEALDPETGLYYLRARYYDPTLGRFIARDPSPGSSLIPTSLNRYQYAVGNPIRYVDPTGLSPWQSLGTFMQSVSGLAADAFKDVVLDLNDWQKIQAPAEDNARFIRTCTLNIEKYGPECGQALQKQPGVVNKVAGESLMKLIWDELKVIPKVALTEFSVVTDLPGLDRLLEVPDTMKKLIYEFQQWINPPVAQAAGKK